VQVGLHKSIVLLEDLSTLLKAEEIFRILRAVKKVVVAERASVLMMLNRPFERRGLYRLFDDVLMFTGDGVSYFGPTKGIKNYCRLIGHPPAFDQNVTGVSLLLSLIVKMGCLPQDR
jgi:hypothetical protein